MVMSNEEIEARLEAARQNAMERSNNPFTRLFRRERSQDEQDILDAYRMQVPVDVIRERRMMQAPARQAAPEPAPRPATTGNRIDRPPPTEQGNDPVAERLAAAREAAIARSRGLAPRQQPAANLPPPARLAAPAQAPAMDRLANTDQMRPTPASAPARQTPARQEPRRRSMPARREMTADELNAMVLRQLGREPFETVPTTREATGPAAERARSRIAERMSQEVQPYKKGGMVKPKAAPKKMMKGGMVAKPTVKGKVKPKGKVMPAFKKGGKVAMKGKK